MLILILFMFAALPPVIAAKGKLYRGLWFALCAIALAIGSLFFLVDIASTRASDPNSVTPQDVASSLMLLSLAASFGCFLAGCTFRPRAKE